MGNGSVTPADADPQVHAFIDMAMQQAKEGNYEGAKDHFMKAKEKTTQANTKEFVEGALELLSLRVESGKLNPPVEKSEEKTVEYADKFNDLKEKLESKHFQEASVTLNTLLKMYCRSIKSIGTFFYDTMNGIVCDTGTFQHIDTDQAYEVKENLLVLVKDLAFVSFQNDKELGIKIDKEDHKTMMEAVKKHISWLKSSEGKVSFTKLYFWVDYVQDILHLMSTTESFSEKMNLTSTMKEVVG